MGMRRITRVSSDGARVLRSGRRISHNVDEPKVKRAKGKVNNKGEDFTANKRRKVSTEAVGDENTVVNKMFGIVYSRKRKSLSNQSSASGSVKPPRSLKFYSRRRRRLCVPLITLTLVWSCKESWLSSVFSLVMRYLRRGQLSLASLASFFLSQPINDVFADHGVRFLAEAPLISRGVCKFFGGVNRLPLLSADISAIPQYFMAMHLNLFLRVAPCSFAFVERSLYLLNNPVEESQSECELVLSPPCSPRNNGGVVVASKLTQCRNNLGFHSFQKSRRSSLRKRRARNISHSVHELSNGTLPSELPASWKNRTAAVSSRKLRSSVVNSSSPGSNGISITPKPMMSREELDSLCCSVNILVIGSDRCTREEGFSAMLEFSSSSREWLVVIKKDEAIRYSHKAKKIMIPSSSNRFTQSVVWIGDNDWKLEFCDRQDWLGFKEIYNECYERNVLEQSVKVIPIPGVREVCGYGEEIGVFPSFSMPVPYISVKEDEVSRAMARSTAIYDMDSEDEAWLRKQNEVLLGEEDEQSQPLQQDTFELMIDGFEKRRFQSDADDLLDEKAAIIGNLSYLGRQEVIEAGHDYWLRKRKKRKAPLLRVFQVYQTKKTPLVSKTVFRKRRSFKKQRSQLNGKSKRLHLVAVKTAEQEAWEEQQNCLRAEEAKALAATAMEIAIARRRRAQVLGENADLAVYKATMARKIAEVKKVAEPIEVPSKLFLN